VEVSIKKTNVLKSIVTLPIIRILIAFIAVSLAAVLAQNIVAPLPMTEMGRNIIVIFVAVPVIVGMYAVYVRWLENRPLTELSLKGAAGEIGKGLLLGLILFCATIGILAVLGVYHLDGMNDWTVMILPLTASILAGFTEEILVRGILFRIIEDSLGTWMALAISAIIFGLLHLANENATMIGALSLIFEAGVLLAAAYMFTRRLWFVIGLHIAWNFTQAGIFGLVVSGNETIPGLLRSSLSGPEWLSGGAFGAEASIVAVVLCFATGIYLIVRSIRKGNIVAPFWVKGR